MFNKARSDKNDPIELAPYDKQWSILAKVEIKRLRTILSAEHIIDIQHVGSTAIPGLLAKPIIDIQIAVDSLAEIKETAVENLKSEGYVYWADNPDKERMFFVKGMPPFGEKRTHHLHIVELKSKHWIDKLLFRDYLIAHPEIARAYGKLKINLAGKHKNDREKYTDEKAAFINTVLEKTKDVS